MHQQSLPTQYEFYKLSGMGNTWEILGKLVADPSWRRCSDRERVTWVSSSGPSRDPDQLVMKQTEITEIESNPTDWPPRTLPIDNLEIGGRQSENLHPKMKQSQSKYKVIKSRYGSLENRRTTIAHTNSLDNSSNQSLYCITTIQAMPNLRKVSEISRD